MSPTPSKPRGINLILTKTQTKRAHHTSLATFRIRKHSEPRSISQSHQFFSSNLTSPLSLSLYDLRSLSPFPKHHALTVLSPITSRNPNQRLTSAHAHTRRAINLSLSLSQKNILRFTSASCAIRVYIQTNQSRNLQARIIYPRGGYIIGSADLCAIIIYLARDKGTRDTSRASCGRNVD